MTHNRSSRHRALRALAPMVLAAAAAPVLAQTNPYLVSYDLRVDGTNAKTATVANVGDTVTLDLFVHVYGTDATSTNDGFQTANGGFMSDTSALHGDIIGLAVPSPFNGSGSAPGLQVDLDQDGDLDVGGTDQSSYLGWYYARANGADYTPDANGEFFIGQAKFTATSLSAASTEVNYFSRSYTSGPPSLLNYGTLAFVDGKSITLRGDDPRVGFGAPVTIYAESVVPPAQFSYISGVIADHLSVAGNVAP